MTYKYLKRKSSYGRKKMTKRPIKRRKTAGKTSFASKV